MWVGCVCGALVSVSSGLGSVWIDPFQVAHAHMPCTVQLVYKRLACFRWMVESVEFVESVKLTWNFR